MKELISLTIYAEVESKDYDKIVCRDLQNNEIYELTGFDILSRINSADTFVNIKEISKTEMANKLLEAGDGIFTVEFIKQGGENRTLRGRLITSDQFMGRVMVEDLDLSSSLSNIRQVDLRTLKSLIIGNVKYVIK
jgi:hypothetical protein